MDSDLQGPVSSFNTEPDENIVLATATAINRSDTHNFDNSSDLDLVNILYVNRIPLVPDAQQAALQVVTDDVNLWEAWEMTRVESMLQTKVNSGDLPKESTVEAKSKRTAYRIKVQQYFRRNAPWLGVSKDVTQSSSTKASPKTINLEVLHMLLATSPLPQDIQFTTLLKALGLGFDAANSMVRPFALTIVDYEYDTTSATFRPQLTTLSFDVDVQDAPKSGREPQSTATLNYSIQQAGFNIGLWDAARPDPKTVELGASILPQRRLNLLSS